MLADQRIDSDHVRPGKLKQSVQRRRLYGGGACGDVQRDLELLAGATYRGGGAVARDNGDAIEHGQATARARGTLHQGLQQMDDTTEDSVLDGRVRLRQPVRGYRAGLDAALLAAACDAGPGARVIEAGCGAGGHTSHGRFSIWIQ